MKHRRRFWLPVIPAVVVALAGCSSAPSTEARREPARIERVQGAPPRIVLSQRAVERLGIQTAAVSDAGRLATGSARRAVPYAAIFYDPSGDTWVYTNTSPRHYARAHIVVDRIDGDVAYLSDGPATGTKVVVVGAAELLGIEYGVGED